MRSARHTVGLLIAAALCALPLTVATTGEAAATVDPTCGDDYYAPYPEDPTKFYQCDDFGGVFIHDCPTLTVFDPTINVCVPDWGAAAGPRD
ncbi:chitin binding peritrophin-A domain-containing protein [Streptomyces sp. NPDC046203]|uniref:chitin binding peritrophin-A domain-containing protein n=1 Tax=Streptomyces sp. NPDC046203 TaxID=3154602 RepID=UPI00340F1FDB